MSDAPRPPEPEDAPSVDELERISTPATVRLAPRFGRIVGTGVGVGFAAGFLCGILLPNSTGVGRGVVGLLVGLGFALIGGIVTGLIAAGLDRGTPAYLKEAKAREADAAAGLDLPDAPEGGTDSTDTDAPDTKTPDAETPEAEERT